MIKDIPGYEELYAVTDNGRVLRKVGYGCLKERWLKMSKTNSGRGYYCVSLSKNGKVTNFRVHRLVATLFIANPDEKKCVNHINGDKLDNRVENLEWATHSENTLHAFKTGLIVHRDWKKEVTV